MKRFDKLKNIKKVNILAEQRYSRRLNESSEIDLINVITQKINDFWEEDSDFDSSNFKIILLNDKIDGLVINGINIDTIEIVANGEYRMTSAGYYRPGRYHGPPEDSYPDESENPEFEIVFKEIKINGWDIDGNEISVMEIIGNDIQKMPKEFLRSIDLKVDKMLLDSGRFDDFDDEPDRYEDY